ncbi:MAG: hypothetical protein JRE38_07700 [Deltaproteobacteria bacterium]|nr:hypothetical protein [Deltaproteobacteria bacterium]MBW2691550.1 hypothetical protein [Deltaproteobacteria bacterium]
MSRCLKRVSAVLITVALLLIQVGPAAATPAQDLENRGETNLVADALILRPLGLVVTVAAAAVWAVGVAPLVAITRPAELGQSMDYLIKRPVKYTFVDPLGYH